MQQSYLFKESKDMLPQIYDKCFEIQEIFQISLDQTLILMNQNKWILERVLDVLTADQQYTVVEKAPALSNVCQICYVDPIEVSLECTHGTCRECFISYLDDQLLTDCFIKCFGDKCKTIIPHSIILKYYNDDQRYLKQLVKSYSKQNKLVRMCNNDRCKYYTDCSISMFESQYVECRCGEYFCLKCPNGDHRPCSCKQADEWIKQQPINKETQNFISKKTKFCPNCRVPIEKNKGCNHMTCKKPMGCGFEFCWICEGSWSEHSGLSGGYYTCNNFDGKKQLIGNNMDQDMSNNEGFAFYQDRYAKLEEELKVVRTRYLKQYKRVQYRQDQNQKQKSEFLLKAYLFLYKARNGIKWTYAFGYYLSQQNRAELPLFEFNQADLERYCKQLQYGLQSEGGSYYQTKILLNQAETFMEKFMIEYDNLINN